MPLCTTHEAQDTRHEAQAQAQNPGDDLARVPGNATKRLLHVCTRAKTQLGWRVVGGGGYPRVEWRRLRQPSRLHQWAPRGPLHLQHLLLLFINGLQGITACARPSPHEHKMPYTATRCTTRALAAPYNKYDGIGLSHVVV